MHHVSSHKKLKKEVEREFQNCVSSKSTVITRGHEAAANTKPNGVHGPAFGRQFNNYLFALKKMSSPRRDKEDHVQIKYSLLRQCKYFKFATVSFFCSCLEKAGKNNLKVRRWLWSVCNRYNLLDRDNDNPYWLYSTRNVVGFDVQQGRYDSSTYGDGLKYCRETWSIEWSGRTPRTSSCCLSRKVVNNIAEVKEMKVRWRLKVL